jgi:hypothetical protein
LGARWTSSHHIGLNRSLNCNLKPTDNACIEAFNGRLRAECLNTRWSLSLDDARSKSRIGAAPKIIWLPGYIGMTQADVLLPVVAILAVPAVFAVSSNSAPNHAAADQ